MGAGRAGPRFGWSLQEIRYSLGTFKRNIDTKHLMASWFRGKQLILLPEIVNV